MKKVIQPECVTLVPENKEEESLLDQLAGCFEDTDKSLTSTVSLDGKELVIWTF